MSRERSPRRTWRSFSWTLGYSVFRKPRVKKKEKERKSIRLVPPSESTVAVSDSRGVRGRISARLWLQIETEQSDFFFFFWRLRGALRWNSAEGTQILYVCELLKTGTFVQYVLCLKYTCTVFIWLCVYSMFTLIFFNVCFFYLLYFASSYSLLKCSSFPRGEHYFFYTVSTQLCLPFNF